MNFCCDDYLKFIYNIIICSFIIGFEGSGMVSRKYVELSQRDAVFSFFCVLIPRCKSFFDFELCKTQLQQIQRPTLSSSFFSFPFTFSCHLLPTTPYLSPSNNTTISNYTLLITFMYQTIFLTRVHDFVVKLPPPLQPCYPPHPQNWPYIIHIQLLG